MADRQPPIRPDMSQDYEGMTHEFRRPARAAKTTLYAEIAALAVKPREELLKLHNGESSGYFESDADWLRENHATAIWLLENFDAIKRALAAYDDVVDAITKERP